MFQLEHPYDNMGGLEGHVGRGGIEGRTGLEGKIGRLSLGTEEMNKKRETSPLYSEAKVTDRGNNLQNCHEISGKNLFKISVKTHVLIATLYHFGIQIREIIAHIITGFRIRFRMDPFHLGLPDPDVYRNTDPVKNPGSKKK